MFAYGVVAGWGELVKEYSRHAYSRHAAVRVAMGLAVVASLAATPQGASAKTPGGLHCHKAVCHRVQTLAETQDLVGRIDTVIASYYGAPGTDRYNPSFETSSGERFDPEADDNVASPVLPDGTVVLLWNPETRQAAIARVNNAGPYMGARRLDVSRRLADVLGFATDGIAPLQQVVLDAPDETEAGYVRGRRYPPVAGALGVFDSVEQAALATEAPDAALVIRPGVELVAPPPRVASSVARLPRSSGGIRSVVATGASGSACPITQWPGCVFATD